MASGFVARPIMLIVVPPAAATVTVYGLPLIAVPLSVMATESAPAAVGV
jgi:hypothetical protein